jgi:hypothetical protein
MSAPVGEAAENREERTTTALTAGVHLTAAVPDTGVGRQPIAMSSRRHHRRGRAVVTHDIGRP